MQTFMNAIEQQNLQCDAVAVHSYGGIDSSAFLAMLDQVYTLYQRPLYVTEFAVADYNAVNGVPNQYSVQQVEEFMQTVCPAMDNLTYVKGYAWYPWPSTNSNALASSVLFNSDGTLTSLGVLYSQLGSSTATTTG
jgi:beta-glucosidase/6-phospho-beta-glucosidase/beta-galactosidase